ncbi:helix-turn-helix domain-containing protein [Saccharopolyspora spinosa]|uniref:Helix-turn-helix protein n=1 Tax=Saccharopolyspora spinosa TaxID=60894 RepID=A0A2N3XQP8_SACSN|nr:helix-turn-helix transcriptional regulator [Saccharopolyspora spinosa]PKW13014.1 helix-turn-helix protein [Saccharopolyspora spinosa]
MANPPPPLARRIELGALLRTYRERASLEVGEVAEALGWSYVQKVGLMESGKRKLAPLELNALLDLYKLSAHERERVIALGKEARKRDTGPAFVADWAQTYVALESAASHLKLYREELVPGLLQTEEYARTILEEGDALTAREIDRAVARRAQRQERLAESDAPRVTVVLSESVLRRAVGRAAVMRGQIDYIHKLANLPNFDVRILPFSVGAHLALGTSFTLLHLGDPMVTFAYVEALTDSDFFDGPPHTEFYTLAFDRAQRASLSSAESLGMLDRVKFEPDPLE